MSVWYVICIILPCNQEYTLCGRATGMLMPHDPPSSYERIRAAPRDSSPFPFVSVRFGANPLHVVSWHCQAIASLVYSFPPPVAACPFRLISRRGPSHISYPSRFSALQHAAFPFHLAALPVLPVVPYLRIVGHVVSPRFRLLPTRSGPCRCCATGTDRAGDRSPATRARSPRPWGSSRGR